MFMSAMWFACEHYLLHFFVSISVYVLLYLIGFHLILPFWILGTFIIDIDHIVDWLSPNNRTEKEIVAILKNKDIPLAIKVKRSIKDYWKNGLIHLLFHNLLFFILVIVLLITFRSNVLATSFLGAILVHQIVDIVGDVHRWGNINNWLWKSEKQTS